MKPPFWLDSNVFIEAKQRYYPFERVPKFWSFLAGKLEDGSVCSPKCVYDELMGYKDQLSIWAKARKQFGMCVPLDPNVQTQMTKVADHVSTKYERRRAAAFLADADPWVIACAMHFGGTVVTQESTSRRTKIRIPVVCADFNVPCIDTFKMLDWFSAKF